MHFYLRQARIYANIQIFNYLIKAKYRQKQGLQKKFDQLLPKQ
jgi:hypothetical protein